jgi:transposase-like protein
MARSTSATRRAEWVERLRRYAADGRTVAEFCAAEGVAPPSFYQWKRRLAAGPSAAAQPRRGRTKHARVSGYAVRRRSGFLPVQLAGLERVEIELPNGARVRVPAGARGALRAAILAAGQVAAVNPAEPPRC